MKRDYRDDIYYTVVGDTIYVNPFSEALVLIVPLFVAMAIVVLVAMYMLPSAVYYNMLRWDGMDNVLAYATVHSTDVDWNYIHQYIEEVSSQSALSIAARLVCIFGPVLVLLLTFFVGLYNKRLRKRIDSAIDDQLLPKQLAALQNEPDSQEYAEMLKQCAGQLSVSGSTHPVDCEDVFTLGLQIWGVIAIVLMLLTLRPYHSVPDYYRGSSDYINMWVSVHTDESLMSEVKEIEELFL